MLKCLVSYSMANSFMILFLVCFGSSFSNTVLIKGLWEYYSTIKKEWNNGTCSNWDGHRDYHTKWSKSDRKKTNIIWYHLDVQFSLLSCVRLFATSWTEAHQAYLSITNSRSLLKLMYIELVVPSNHLILCHHLLLPPSIIPSIRVFSNESVLCIRWPKYRSFSFSIRPSKELPKSLRTPWKVWKG